MTSKWYFTQFRDGNESTVPCHTGSKCWSSVTWLPYHHITYNPTFFLVKGQVRCIWQRVRGVSEVLRSLWYLFKNTHIVVYMCSVYVATVLLEIFSHSGCGRSKCWTKATGPGLVHLSSVCSVLPWVPCPDSFTPSQLCNPALTWSQRPWQCHTPTGLKVCGTSCLRSAFRNLVCR